MAPRKRCPVCRSKQWHKEPSSGLIACSEGHILQQNYRNEASELEEVGPHLLKKRTLKSNRQNKVQTSGLDPKLYHGNRGRYFYFQCLQFILRHQIAVLTERWALPKELEVVCRDLWALHLSLLRNPPPAEPYLAAQESDEEAQDANPTASTPERQGESPPLDFEDPKTPSSDEETDEAENDPELDELLAENSASESSSSDGEDQVDTKSMPPAAKSKRTGRHKFEQPANTVAVIIVACWTLRVPILYRDLRRQVAQAFPRSLADWLCRRLIESYELPYLEATRVLPPSMTVHLTKHNMQALSPPKTPGTLALHKLASSLARRIHSTFGVLTPEVNAAPILWRTVTQCLGGSPTLYRLTKRLATVLSLPLTLHHSLAPRLQRIKARDPESHKYDNVAPELAFLATGIIVLKMVYGLDAKRSRLPADSEDPACDMPQIEEYLELLRRLDDGDGPTRFDSKTAMTIEDLSDDTVDEYLTFCERALVGSGNADQDVLERYFPLRASERTEEGAAATERPRQELEATGLQDGEEEVLRPGEGYALGPSEELPDGYLTVVNRAAEWAGVEKKYLCVVVGNYERRVWRWWQRERKGEREREREREYSEDVD
ncbi:hypothetical protein C8R44DRAFT_908212 [Mycena epipterygia]|nr:hypothetical protein C8R44DRAFT_908212 [Mycena epipterygia]